MTLAAVALAFDSWALEEEIVFYQLHSLVKRDTSCVTFVTYLLLQAVVDKR